MEFNANFTQALLERIGGNSVTLVLDSVGVCKFASSQSSSVLGIPPEDLHLKNFIDALPLYTMEGKLVDRIQHPVGRSLDHKNFVQTTPFFCKLSDAEEAGTLALNTFQIMDGNKIDAVVVQMRKAKREVEVGEMKTLFVSFAAHQLKTPSSVVKGFLELMMREGENSYTKDQWYFLSSAFESNENLISVSKTLLNMARLEGGLIEPKIQPFNPIAAINNKVNAVKPLCDLKGLLVSVESDSEKQLELHSDESFFSEILGVILGNAIKHSPNNSSIRVVCKLQDKSCEVHVIDQGSGIPQAIREKLFSTGQESSGDGESHGLGLLIAKKYTALIGGKIGLAESEAGSDFYFSVPNVNQ